MRAKLALENNNDCRKYTNNHSPLGLGGLPSMNPYSHPHLQPNPPFDNSTPGINLRNPTGGIGLEPGYNYLFPIEHCKIHVLKCPGAPWQLETNHTVPYQAHVVPTNITVRQLMQQFGCDNPDPLKNCVHEYVQGVNGKWYKGVSVNGSEIPKMDKKLEEMGWNLWRNGRDREIVWLWFTKG
jgi:hypothetical protein